MSHRAIKRIIPQQPPHWVGDGFHVYPVFGPLAFTAALSPWLMFDYASPKEFPPTTSRRGVGKHPHRGFETVTIAFQGSVEHADSVGNRDVIGPGDVQWMTAGRGIVHEEFHSKSFATTGGVFEMCQLWLNLPKEYKMHQPRYQAILDKTIPVVDLGGDGRRLGRVRVIAGRVGDVSGPAMTFSPVELWDVIVETVDNVVELEVPEGHNVHVFVRKGEIVMDGTTVGPQSIVLMNREGGVLRFSATRPDSQVLVMGGEPLNEPIAARGPFVMNTQEEIYQANRDYQSGKMER